MFRTAFRSIVDLNLKWNYIVIKTGTNDSQCAGWNLIYKRQHLAKFQRIFFKFKTKTSLNQYTSLVISSELYPLRVRRDLLSSQYTAHYWVNIWGKFIPDYLAKRQVLIAAANFSHILENPRGKHYNGYSQTESVIRELGDWRMAEN